MSDCPFWAFLKAISLEVFRVWKHTHRQNRCSVLWLRKTTNKFDARVDIVRQLFTQGTLPDNDFLNHGFAQAKRKAGRST